MLQIVPRNRKDVHILLKCSETHETFGKQLTGSFFQGLGLQVRHDLDNALAFAHVRAFVRTNKIRDVTKQLIVTFGGSIDQDHIAAHWDDVLRLGASIRAGTVTASAMLKKLSAYPRQNGLAVALRELGRIERTLFTLEWLKSMDLRRRANAGLNKGEARNALARAVFLYRLGEMRDRSFESQAYRASGLNLLVAAIIRAFAELRRQGRDVRPELAKHVAPLGWEHIGLTGDYVWSSADLPADGSFRPLRRKESLSCLFVLTSRTICALSCRHPQLNHSASHPGVAGARTTLLFSPLAALIGGAGETGVARNRLSIS